MQGLAHARSSGEASGEPERRRVAPASGTVRLLLAARVVSSRDQRTPARVDVHRAEQHSQHLGLRRMRPLGPQRLDQNPGRRPPPGAMYNAPNTDLPMTLSGGCPALPPRVWTLWTLGLGQD